MGIANLRILIGANRGAQHCTVGGLEASRSIAPVAESDLTEGLQPTDIVAKCLVFR